MYSYEESLDTTNSDKLLTGRYVCIEPMESKTCNYSVMGLLLMQLYLIRLCFVFRVHESVLVMNKHYKNFIFIKR